MPLRRVRICRTSLGLAAVLPLVAGSARAQELEPRVYLASPVGSNVVVVGLGRSTGDVLFDPTLPIEDGRARVGAFALAYYRSFGLFGRSASLGATLPVLRGHIDGLLSGSFAQADRFGMADVPVRLTINLAGAPAMDLPALIRRGRRPELGASVIVKLPVGQYDGSRIINIGTNRWAVKPELGLSWPVGDRWLIDSYVGVWLFGDNDNYQGRVQSQDPLYVTQFHLSYNLSRRAWVAVDSTFYAGGRTVIDGSAQPNRVSSTRLGATLSLPIADRQALRFSASSGAWVRVGTDFTTFAVAWTYGWGRGF